MKKYGVLVAAVPLFCGCISANAQSSVTLYGLIDNGIDYISNVGGKSNVAMESGDFTGSRWGIRGSEDLGTGLHAVFRLESGFNVNNGKLGQGGALFGRAAYVGLQHNDYGEIRMGRQYNAATEAWAPYTATFSTIGAFADHPLDNDNSDGFYRSSNAAKYISPQIGGFQFEASYAFSNSTNFADNREYSFAGTYNYGSLSGVVAYTRVNNPSSATNPNGAIQPTTAFSFIGSSMQNIGAGLRWNFSNLSNLTLAYSHVDVYSTPDGTIGNVGYGVTLKGQDAWKFDNVELNGQYYISPALSVAAAYTFTHAGVFALQSGSAVWHQGSLILNYALSKRSSLYVMGAYQHANRFAAAQFGADIAGYGKSSSQNQALARIAVLHKF
ncbi:porin [Paraburkholderia phenoliruptrix]|uniref:porin n=1 Tax=Paraburkholderia phenoliruptrix TaxID=252970 RepID=UPI0028698252|nr:porin [Paraburkholderia phenoliruptrix]WMY11051.1 porin [Paraburkholderia phenoliruptrix]